MRDLTDAGQNQQVLRLAQTALTCEDSRARLSDTVPIDVEAMRCVESREALEHELKRMASKSAVHLSIVWAMYKETERIRKRDDSNPHGEDFLAMKIEQIRWLVKDLKIRWHLIAVDDGCPAEPSSAVVASEILSQRTPVNEDKGEQVTVLKLEDVIDGRARPATTSLLSKGLQNLQSTKESRKGGSILYGLAHALTERRNTDAHVVLYTDADLSANLAQAGLLAAPIVGRRAEAVAGQRYGMKNAVLVKEDAVSKEPESTCSKPDSMVVLLRQYIRTRLLPDIDHIADTQAGFKAFDAAAMRKIIKQIGSLDESFDVELLVRFARSRGKDAVDLAPIVFVEDFAVTNFPSVDPEQRHLDMINQLVDLYDRLTPKKTKPPTDVQKLVGWLQGLSLPGYVATIDHLMSIGQTGFKENRSDKLPMFEPDWPFEELQAAAAKAETKPDAEEPEATDAELPPTETGLEATIGGGAESIPSGRRSTGAHTSSPVPVGGQ